MRRSLILASALFLVAGACLAGLTVAQPAATQDRPPAAACSAPSTVPPLGPDPLPVQGCNFCTGEDFCPESGVRCSYLGTCDKGANRCCNYSCQCDPTCTSVSVPNEICPYQVPTCSSCPPRTLCEVSYCGSEGIRCSFSGTCGPGGCCSYDCGPDPTCILPDPLPPNAC